MNNDYILYKKGSVLDYATSISASWAFPSDLFVAAVFGYLYGLAGIIAFSFFNSFTFIIFGLVSYNLISKNNTIAYSLIDSLKNFPKSLKIVFCCLALYRIIQSVLYQSIGFQEITVNYFPEMSKFAVYALLCFISLSLVWKWGIKGSIVTDKWKYFIIVVCGVVITGDLIYSGNVDFSKVILYDKAGFDELFDGFLMVSIACVCQPYVDQTLWQRVLSIPKDKIVKTCTLSSFIFLVIPLVFGFIGLVARTFMSDPNWSLSVFFNGNSMNGILLSLALICVVVSTMDSDLCAIQSMYSSFTRDISEKSKISMICLILFCGTIFCLFDMSMLNLTFFSSTIKAVVLVPVLMYIYNVYDENRLLLSMILALAVGIGGYTYCYYAGNNLGSMFVTLAVFLPLLGYKSNKA